MVWNPFSSDIYPDGYPVAATEFPLHAVALEQFQRLLDRVGAGPDLAGRVVLLKAPRAGFGKSHLLELVRQRQSSRAFVVAVEYDADRDLKWAGLFWQVLEQLHASPSGAGQGSLLDVLTRHLFARINQELIRQGRIPCANPEAALGALETRHFQLFDFSDSKQPVARWFAEHFERLLPAASQLLAREGGLEESAAAGWLRMLCGYAQGIADGPEVRFAGLRWAVQQGHAPAVQSGGLSLVQAPMLDEPYFKDRLMELGRLAGLCRPVVFLVDHLDRIQGGTEMPVKLAGILSELRRLQPHALIVLSVNQDLWANVFQKFLPSALEDRLSGDQVHLEGLSRSEADALLRHRLHHAGVDVVQGESFLDRLRLPELMAKESGRVFSARSLLRHAARLWEETEAERAAGKSDVAPLRLEDAPLFEASGGPTEPPLTPPGADPAASAPMPVGGTSFQQLKSMLEKLRLGRKFTEAIAPERPASASGVVLADPPHSLASGGTVPVTGAPAPQLHPVEEKFHALRQRLLHAKPLRIDQDIFSHLLETGGRRLAVVRVEYLAIPGFNGPAALVWHTPDGEIFFGSEPAEDVAYWKALAAHVRETQLRSGNGNRQRLTVFSAQQSPADLQQWLAADQIAEAKGRYLDIVSLDQDSLATLYAADELLHASEHANEGLPPADEIFLVLSDHLDGFWKRLTRPLIPLTR
ncbi:MAG: hypothetical protein KA004_12660 [Verrucomicrobiales bacterium]|nr:hypothetical protein [Verrucomicrobiales bacterium]